MNPSQVIVANLVAVLLAAAFLGIAWSGRASHCRSFTAFLAAALVTNRLVVWWPATFFTYQFWAWKEAGYVVLQLAIALELAVIGLAPFPRARRLTLLAVTGVTTAAAVCAVTLPLPDNGAEISVVLARAHTATLWTFGALAFVVAWFHLPLDAFHRIVLLGFVLDLSLYGALLGIAGWVGRESTTYEYLQALDPILFAATVGLWAIAAWHPRALARRDDEGTLAVWREILSGEGRPLYELFVKRAAARERAIAFTRADVARARQGGELLHAARLERAGQEFEAATLEEGRQGSLLRRMLSALR